MRTLPDVTKHGGHRPLGMLPTPPPTSPPACPSCGSTRAARLGDGQTRFKCGATTESIRHGRHFPPVGTTPIEHAEHYHAVARYKKHRSENNLGRDPLV